MECGIDEWGTGIKTDIVFTAVDYHTVFAPHLKCLRDFWEATKKHELLDKICVKLYNVGQYVISLKPLFNQLSNFGLASILGLNQLLLSLLQFLSGPLQLL